MYTAGLIAISSGLGFVIGFVVYAMLTEDEPAFKTTIDLTDLDPGRVYHVVMDRNGIVMQPSPDDIAAQVDDLDVAGPPEEGWTNII